MALTDKLTAIANAIRAKTGKTGALTPGQMPDEIASIPTGNAAEPFVEETYNSDGNLTAAKLVGHTKVRTYAFYNCTKLALTELPTGITSIGSSAFSGCTKLALTELPAGITSIGNYAFSGCSNLKTITFKGNANSISPYAFSGCSNLTTINAPWAEGEVANAPWGATNATINYNYTEEG